MGGDSDSRRSRRRSDRRTFLSWNDFRRRGNGQQNDTPSLTLSSKASRAVRFTGKATSVMVTSATSSPPLWDLLLLRHFDLLHQSAFVVFVSRALLYLSIFIPFHSLPLRPNNNIHHLPIYLAPHSLHTIHTCLYQPHRPFGPSCSLSSDPPPPALSPDSPFTP
jgi:hypothetical protein